MLPLGKLKTFTIKSHIALNRSNDSPGASGGVTGDVSIGGTSTIGGVTIGGSTGGTTTGGSGTTTGGMGGEGSTGGTGSGWNSTTRVPTISSDQPTYETP